MTDIEYVLEQLASLLVEQAEKDDEDDCGSEYE